MTERMTPMGLRLLNTNSRLPNRKSLFGTELSPGSYYMLEPLSDNHFDWEDRIHLHQGYWPYDYGEDVEYKMLLSDKIIRGLGNLNLLQYLRSKKLVLLPWFLADEELVRSKFGPRLAPGPDNMDSTGFIYPSYIIWSNDPSYFNHIGIPDNVELPKYELRKTTGHPDKNTSPIPNRLPRLSSPGWYP